MQRGTMAPRKLVFAIVGEGDVPMFLMDLSTGQVASRAAPEAGSASWKRYARRWQFAYSSEA